MTCNQLGGACEEKFTAETFNEIADMSKRHGMEMFEKGDTAHLEAMKKMKGLMQTPNGIQEWFESKRKEFDALQED
jgi:predicted component of type VI protein secretion system